MLWVDSIIIIIIILKLVSLSSSQSNRYQKFRCIIVSSLCLNNYCLYVAWAGVVRVFVGYKDGSFQVAINAIFKRSTSNYLIKISSKRIEF